VPDTLRAGHTGVALSGFLADRKAA
jgi:hypothetical protein